MASSLHLLSEPSIFMHLAYTKLFMFNLSVQTACCIYDAEHDWPHFRYSPAGRVVMKLPMSTVSSMGIVDGGADER